MSWNYRIVNIGDGGDGEDHFELCEVYYDGDGKPYGYCSVSVASEQPRGIVDQLILMLWNANEQLVLRHDEFDGDPPGTEDDAAVDTDGNSHGNDSPNPSDDK